jgi:hypothetical protein
MKYRDTSSIIGDRFLIGIGVFVSSLIALGTLRLSWIVGKGILSDWSNNWPYVVMLSSPIWLYLIGWAIERTVLDYLDGNKKQKEK